jgi:hypothetical protein
MAPKKKSKVAAMAKAPAPAPVPEPEHAQGLPPLPASPRIPEVSVTVSVSPAETVVAPSPPVEKIVCANWDPINPSMHLKPVFDEVQGCP